MDPGLVDQFARQVALRVCVCARAGVRARYARCSQLRAGLNPEPRPYTSHLNALHSTIYTLRPTPQTGRVVLAGGDVEETGLAC